MPKMNFATLINIFHRHEAKKYSDEDAIMLFLYSITEPLLLETKYGNPLTVDKSKASKIMKNLVELPPPILEHKDSPKVLEKLDGYFQKNVAPAVMKGKENEFRHALKNAVESDETMDRVWKDKLLHGLEKNELWEILRNLFQYTLCHTNRTSSGETGASSPKPQPMKRRERVSVPQNIADIERPYIHALEKIYGERENIPGFNLSMLPAYEKWAKHLKDERRRYWNAEELHRLIRDGDLADEDTFEDIKDDIYDGISGKLDLHYKDGMDRFSEISTIAGTMALDAYHGEPIGKELRPAVRKGFLHILVNDGRIKSWKDKP